MKLELINKKSIVLSLSVFFIIGVIIISNIDFNQVKSQLPGLQISEQETEKGKIITISAPDELNYENVLGYTELSKEALAEKIHLYHLTKQDKQEIEVEKYDKNNNGLIDYIEWNVPHLSNQTYELEIIIIDAEHLDSNKNFISNIYEEVEAIDNITYTIPENQYVRAYFETNLTNKNVIDIYVHNTEPSTIEVYEKDSDVVIGRIENVLQGIYYIELNHSESQSIFDLKSVGGDIVYDFIHDAASLSDQSFSTDDADNTIAVGEPTTITASYKALAAEWIGEFTVQVGGATQITNVCGDGRPVYLTDCDVGDGLPGDCVCTPTYTVSCPSSGWTKNTVDTVIWTVQGCTGGGGELTYNTLALSGIGAISFSDVLTVNNPPDLEYPQFSDYWDDNGTLVGGGKANFNVTVISTNGTVQLEIDGNNITATNLTMNVYNASYTFSSAGTYEYTWNSWGNGTANNYNFSVTQSYVVNASPDTCTAPESGNWAIDCSDDCVWATDFSVPANISMIGSGTLIWNANMTMSAGSWEIYKGDGCDMVINSAGSIR
ncbi:MAG: hypothetical protein ABIH79_00555 [archaeon]